MKHLHLISVNEFIAMGISGKRGLFRIGFGSFLSVYEKTLQSHYSDWKDCHISSRLIEQRTIYIIFKRNTAHDSM
jgi:hypothetical protein